MVLKQIFVAMCIFVLQACSSGSDPATDIDNSGNCGNDHPAVGSRAEFSMLAHDVSGTLNVIDNCTLQITNFNYDGRGPDVFFYAAQDQDYTGPGYFQVGDRLNGTSYEDDTVVLELPEGKTLDDFNSLSVWCVQFGANFGDAFWGGR